MTRVRAIAGGVAVTLAERELDALIGLERALLATVAARSSSTPGTGAPPHPLFPDAYRDDPEAAFEFHALTDADLAQGKTEDALAVMRAFHVEDAVAGPARGRHARRTAAERRTAEFVGDGLMPLLRNLTDLRLTLAHDLGIENDGDRGHPGHAHARDRAVYLWLGGVQELIVDSLLA